MYTRAMPELPEVETVAAGLRSLVLGKQVERVEILAPKIVQSNRSEVAEFFEGANIQSVDRRGKVLLLGLSSQYTAMMHLKMTGQLVYVDTDDRFGAGHPNASLVATLPDRSTRVVVHFAEGGHLFFNDQRKFGWIKLVPTSELMEETFLKKLGPEPLDPDFTSRMFMERLATRTGSLIKAALLDQTVIAGVGNIYADEALYAARVHPARRVANVTNTQLAALYAALREVLLLSIELGGSSDKNYVNAEGKKGSYISFAKVFRREGLQCERDGALIQKYRIAGRGTHICPVCQKRPRGFSYEAKRMRGRRRTP